MRGGEAEPDERRIKRPPPRPTGPGEEEPGGDVDALRAGGEERAGERAYAKCATTRPSVTSGRACSAATRRAVTSDSRAPANAGAAINSAS